jgi:hypothetical protein
MDNDFGIYPSLIGFVYLNVQKEGQLINPSTALRVDTERRIFPRLKGQGSSAVEVSRERWVKT